MSFIDSIVFPDDGEEFDYLSSPQYTQYSTDRLRSEMEVVPIPMPYESWDFAVANYGPTLEEYESLGIDLQSWYDAH